jgi:hypothetical protein
MSSRQWIILLTGLGLLGIAAKDSAAQNVGRPTAGVLSLDNGDNQRHVAATVGQQIQITLQTIGPGQYALPQVSSLAVRFEDIALRLPNNPGGPTQVFIFTATAEGTALVRIAHSDSRPSFTATIEVGPTTAKLHAPLEDQVNRAPSTAAWTNLLNDVEQTFSPSLPRLTSVEVELVVGNPGKTSDQITLMLLDENSQMLVEVSRIVSAADCGHVVFVLPDGGLEVSPGKTYRIRLTGGSLFGWKYVEGGYEKGAALFNGKPLLPGNRSSFLFRTFGEP